MKSSVDPCMTHVRACGNTAHMSVISRFLHGLRFLLQHNTKSHIAKHNKTQQNTTFSKDSSGASYLFSTTYTGLAQPGPVRRQRPLPAVNYGYRKMQGGPRSLRHNPNRRNGSPILFFGEAAFHCIRERPNRSIFAKIDDRALKIAVQVIHGCHFPGLPRGQEGVKRGSGGGSGGGSRGYLDFAAFPGYILKAPGVSPKYFASNLAA
jgi:hypothetical protein